MASTILDYAEKPAARRNLMRLYMIEAKYEFVKLIRVPAYTIPTILFPAAFYLFFGVAFGEQGVGGVMMAAYLLATYGAFGVIGAALFGFGVSVAAERGQGWIELKRATPMPISAYFSSKIVMSALFSSVILLVLFTLGATLGGVQLAAMTWLRLFGVLVVGALPFCLMGLTVGCLTGPSAAPPILNLIYLPMSFLSGLWVPVEALPDFLRALAPWLPPYHLAQLALGVIGAGRGEPAWFHLAALAIYGALFLLTATLAWRHGMED